MFTLITEPDFTLTSTPAIFANMADETTLAYLRKFDSKLDAISDRLRSLEVRFGAIESRFSALEERMAGVEFHLERIERRLGLAETPAS